MLGSNEGIQNPGVSGDRPGDQEQFGTSAGRETNREPNNKSRTGICVGLMESGRRREKLNVDVTKSFVT